MAADQGYLARMAKVLKKSRDAKKWEETSEATHRAVREQMYDPVTGWFYDKALGGNKLLTERGRGIEGAVPLWTESATQEQAKAVRAKLMNPEEFNTKVPFPTVSKSSPYFSATRYWRGPVWLDQAYYALKGLQNYGYKKDARTLQTKLLSNVAGLSGNGPIHENYNPLNGDGMNAPNFSWSSALILDLLSN